VLVDLFEERLVDYKAGVRRTTPDGIASAVESVLSQRVRADARIVVPIGLNASWRTDADTIVDDGTLTAAELDGSDGVLTACAVAIAETGTIVLDAQADQGRRAISLVPDLHICVVRTDQIVADVPDALRLLDPTRPLTFISGGSATSDIELKRVEGVHGPRTLEVIIVDQPRR
jgi:L-lactate dehydrogenase complex protein LldG